MTLRSTLVTTAALGLAIGPVGVARAQYASPTDWLSAGNGLTDNHFQPFEFALGRTTVPYLGLKWTFTADGDVEGTPTVSGGSVYFADRGGSVWRVDAATGKTIWKASLPSITGSSASFARVSPAIGDGVIIVGDNTSGTVIALSQATGKKVWSTVLATDVGAIITSSPVVAGGRVYLGVASEQETLADFIPGFVVTLRGSIASLDEKTGKIVWQSYMVPPSYTGGAVWSSNLAIDAGRNALYAVTGNNYSVPSSVAACQTAAGTDPVALDKCLPSTDHLDSIVSLNLATGAVIWGDRFTHADTYTVSCRKPPPVPPQTPCPSPSGPDTDFGSAPNLFTIKVNGVSTDVVGAGQKTGTFWTVNRDTGAIIWGTQVGPGGEFGGIEWGTATDGNRIYVALGNTEYVETTLITGQKTNGGFWSALDPTTGKILWETPTTSLAPKPAQAGSLVPPAGALAAANGSVSVANGVMYGEDTAGNLDAFDAATGKVLFDYPSGGAGIAAPAISNGTLYWASGYYLTGATSNKVYAFSLGGL